MNKVIKALGVGLVVVFARLLPFNIIVGSVHAVFSWSSIFAPVVAAQCGFSWVFTFIISKKLWVAPSFILLFHRIPVLCAARAFQKREWIVSLCLPIACMALFMSHPVGSKAWPYALYWLIPGFLYLLKDAAWVRALQASFVAHAVGSIVWLYSGSIAAEVWMSLIPLVACERLLIAGGIVMVHEICHMFKAAFYFLRKAYISTYKATQ